MEFKKQPINFSEIGFWSENEKFKRDKPLKKDVINEYKKLTGADLEDFLNIENQALNFFQNSASDNVMNLDAITYCKLKNIDFTGLKIALSKFKNVQEPNPEIYTSYTKNKEANERLKDLKTIVNDFKKLADKIGVNPIQIVKALPQYMYSTGEVIIYNEQYINSN